MGTIDHDAVLRARLLLLASGRPERDQLVDAYRTLVEVNPKAYAPLLVDALLSTTGRDTEVRLASAVEAVEAGRRIEVGAPAREERLRRALNAYQRALFALGRRAEGRAVCEELAEEGWSARLANVLAEEGRFREAAELNEKAARNGMSEQSLSSGIEWAANLEGAGLHDTASEVFREVIDVARRLADEQRTSPAVPTWALVHHSRMREAAGHPAEAAAARRDALTVLEQLASTGGSTGGGHLTAWVTLFVLSGRSDEPAASAESPMPPFGTALGWSGDTRDAFIGALPGLEAEAAAHREAGRLPELVDTRRRIGIRLAARHGDRHYRFVERFEPHFDEAVELARRLPDDPARLARALTDRSMFLVAAGTFGPAYADFAEAVTLLDGRWSEPGRESPA
ncbi:MULTISPECIES: hypothetical protein [unclassified Streptomyces]|uniref:hypothetical protein n=1 Tax=unclassified Streptomyces TaxID=2593676 RepID=UPI0004BD9144|nr:MULTISPECIES: hypothetical protein [unclassified Streptomyces]